MKKNWSQPIVVEISTKMTEEQAKTHGTGDVWAPADLSDWTDCNCCS
ncbi:MAG: hypothetical protein WC364_00715 [Eubacteriales bacterium]